MRLPYWIDHLIEYPDLDRCPTRGTCPFAPFATHLLPLQPSDISSRSFGYPSAELEGTTTIPSNVSVRAVTGGHCLA